MTEVDPRNRMSRLGILGGTFDPPHIGHLILADQCRQALRLDSLLILPAGMPPHKNPDHITPFQHRAAMARLAFPESEGYAIEPLEGERKGPSYTVETLRALYARGGGRCSFWLLMGSDSMAELETWKEPEAIVSFCRLGVYGRPLYHIDGLKKQWLAHVDSVEGPLVDISSTQIRQMVRAGKSLNFLVPERVRKYILTHGLYAGKSPAGANG
ncbi:MAG: nicotinate-nucleotide adenylyltransferase [Candidatus Eisenbacteria bacterium]|uniref:Probable nicotinate-nucleotide adenylyltransferase n=1 Tax=Eiseniibacteriota bacterium TaxID=2212470 RepID=A0A948W4Z1_UNCEI|nr:nicotinate-nucleotide adenylyltransferase [Candidatus Eisenbacteria bacterium]MBU1950134.1 nicotinate-nucleotide adenylyltransferase [Candidatus Eisenbacteria bacterium]MBU2689844.1 nicotinate-nucleotide adenylyltransferase [Candidatus Eisenbacteria bacterium]